jgi:hypothetical protein
MDKEDKKEDKTRLQAVEDSQIWLGSGFCFSGESQTHEEIREECLGVSIPCPIFNPRISGLTDANRGILGLVPGFKILNFTSLN